MPSGASVARAEASSSPSRSIHAFPGPWSPISTASAGAIGRTPPASATQARITAGAGARWWSRRGLRAPRREAQGQLARRLVNPHRVADAARVAAAERHHHRDAALGASGDHQAIALDQPGERQTQRAELIVLVGIRARLVEHDLRRVLPDARQRPGEPVVELRVVGAVLESDVEIAPLLHRIEMLLVDGEGEHVVVVAEDAGGAVALMEVAVDDRRASDRSLALQDADRD